MKMSYKKSVELALANGYEAIKDENAYKGVYYIREGLIWIHDIQALMHHLGVSSVEALEELNYDVAAYHEYKGYSDQMVDNELKSLYSELSPSEGEPAYLMDGMYLFPDGSIREL